MAQVVEKNWSHKCLAYNCQKMYSQSPLMQLIKMNVYLNSGFNLFKYYFKKYEYLVGKLTLVF